MTIMRIALAKAQALPSTIDERLAKIRKASLTRQKKSRGRIVCCRPENCGRDEVHRPILLSRAPDIHRPLRLPPSGDLPPPCAHASRRDLLLLSPAAEPQGLGPFDFRQP